jgi:polysaccharide pyruvyl transferase WcaK-like protein
VAVCLREHATLTNDRRNRLIRALATFQAATTRDGQPACMVLLPFQPERDRSIAQEVAAQLPGPHQILELDDPRQLKGVFAGVEMAIAMRLHALIMAAAAQCRCFALSYDPKVTALMDELDLPGWDLTLPDATVATPTSSANPAGDRALPTQTEVLVKTWLELYANGDPLGGDRASFLRDRAKIHREVLAQALAP